VLSQHDESTITAGHVHAVRRCVHDNQCFLFHYKYRQRFAVVAKGDSQRILGLPAEELERIANGASLSRLIYPCLRGEECVCLILFRLGAIEMVQTLLRNANRDLLWCVGKRVSAKSQLIASLTVLAGIETFALTVFGSSNTSPLTKTCLHSTRWQYCAVRYRDDTIWRLIALDEMTLLLQSSRRRT